MTYTLRLSPVYPRWRGEHHITTGDHVGQFGLSPLARGTHSDCFGDIGSTRFIPAGAGNTAAATGNCGLHMVYPRWRGEHRPSLFLYLLHDGLSPLARGTRQLL